MRFLRTKPYDRPAMCTQTTDNKPNSEEDRAKWQNDLEHLLIFKPRKEVNESAPVQGKSGDSESSRFTTKKRKRAAEVIVNIGVMAFDKNKMSKLTRGEGEVSNGKYMAGIQKEATYQRSD